jgi:hypothetical protein
LSFGVPLLTVSSPASVAGKYSVGTAAFGAALDATGVTGEVVPALDAADAGGPTNFDACSAITNAASVSGRIALVDRGTCGFIVKVKNAQNAGAIAVIVADNAIGSPPAGLGGADPTITIPSVRITQADGATLRAALGLGSVNARMGLDVTARAGAHPILQKAQIYSPNPAEGGSSVSHYDTIASRNQLMEPSINRDLTHSLRVPEDLTLELMRDIGWYPDGDLDMVSDEGLDQCLGTDFRATINIQSCNTGVASSFSAATGCTRADLINRIAASARNHGEFVSAVSQLSNQWKKNGDLSGAEHAAIVSCAAGSSLP